MKRIRKIGMILAMSILILLFCTTGAFAAMPKAEEIGVQYRGHVQNKGDMPQPVGTMVKGPDALGTRGESLRVEGFWIELTGDVPEGAAIKYQVHVQNEGWMEPVKDGKFAGTAGESQRIEAIKISLENLPGYDVYYRGHVQNVGDVPQVDGDWGWKKNGEELGTTGSSLRLEELQIKIVKQPDATRTYDKAGTYGPKTGVEVIENDVAINTPDVVLQNLHIKGNLTIGEGVGEGDVTLNNVTVDGDTFVRGGGKNSIHINGGNYNKITVQQTSSGQVRIVATDAAGLEVVVSEDATGEDIILEGAFENVQIDAPDVKVSTQGDTAIKQMNLGEAAKGSEVTLGSDTKVENLVVDSDVDVKGQGTVEKAAINSDGVTFEKAPVKQDVDPGVVTPPVVTPPIVVPPIVPTPTPGGSGGGYVPPADVAVTSVAVNKETLQLTVGGATQTITATISPANATNKNVVWTSSNTAIATVNNGVVTPVAVGTATITAKSSADNSKTATTTVTVKAPLTAAKIAVNRVDPSAVISLYGDTFSEGASTINNWTINPGTTGLTINSITLHGVGGTATSATVYFTGTAALGTIEMTPKAAALTSDMDGNTASVIVTDQPLVKSTTPTTDTAVVAKTAQTQKSVEFTLTSTHPRNVGTWSVYSNAACTTKATAVAASLSGNKLTLTHETDLPAATYYVVYNDGIRTDSDALALTVLAYSEEPTTVSVVTAPTLVASNGDLLVNFDEPSDLTGIDRIQMLVSCDGGNTWATAATALVAADPSFSSDMLSLSLTRISYRLQGMTTINKIKVNSIAKAGYLDSQFEMPCSLTINKAAQPLSISATYNNGTVHVTMPAQKQENETYFSQLSRANGSLITEGKMGDNQWINPTTTEFTLSFMTIPADARIQIVKGSGAAVINASTGSVEVTPLQAGGVTFTNNTPVKSTTPTATTTTVAKTTQTQATVDFTLTSSHSGGTWKVYSNAEKTTEATGVTATLSGNTLTLTHATDLPAATYYVVWKEGTNTDSDALALTVGAHEDNHVDVVKNARFEASNGTSTIYFDQPADKTGIQNYQIMFSSDNGQTWNYTAQYLITNDATIALDMSTVAININDTKMFNKVKVVSGITENSVYQENEASFPINFTITKEGSELAVVVARNQANDVEITLPGNATADETYAVRIFDASGVGTSSTTTIKGSQITGKVITMSHATQPISGLSEGAIFKVCKINNCTTSGLSVTPMQATGVPINSTPPTLSSEKVITATTVGTLTGGNITGVPAGTKVSVLKSGLSVSPNATVEILISSGGSAVADQTNTDVTADMIIKVTAQNGTSAEYTIAMAPVQSDAKVITETTVGTLTGGNITGVLSGTKVSALKAGLTVSAEATVEIITGAGGTAVADQANTDVTADMKIKVTAQNGTSAEYTIAMAPVQSDAKAITDTTVGTLTAGNITGVLSGTKVSALKAGLTVSANATVEIITGAGGTAVADQATTDVTADMKIKVTAQNGSSSEYTITMAPVQSSAKSITDTTVGNLTGGNITGVPVGTRVSALKSGLTVSADATVEILAGAGGSVVANQAATDVSPDMKIQVTAQDDSKIEYTITMGAVGVASNPQINVVSGSDTFIKYEAPANMAGISAFEIMFSKDAGSTWENEKLVNVDQYFTEWSLQAVMSVASGYVNETTTYNKMKVISQAKTGYQQSENLMDLNYTITKTGEALAITATRNAEGKVEVKLPAEKTLNETYIYQVLNADGSIIRSDLISVTADMYWAANDTIVLPNVIVPSNDSLIKISRITDGSETGLNATPLQTTGVGITMAPVQSDAKVITDTTVGTLTAGNITGVTAGTKVSALKVGLTVSANATVEIITGAGGTAVADQATTDVSADMKIKVTAQNGTSAEYTITMVAATLVAPTNLSAEPGSNRITLSWNAAPNAQSYKIYRSTTSGSDYIEIASGVASTSCQAVNLTPGQTYYFVIKAVAAGYSDSIASSEASAIANVDLTGSSYSGNKLVVTNESLDLATQSTGTLSNITMDSQIIDGLDQDAYRINPEIPVTQAPGQPLINSSMESNMVVANVNDERSFNTHNYQTQQYDTIAARCAYVGTHSEIWVNKNEAAGTTLTAEEAQTLATEFDQNIYDLITTNFYAAPDVNSDSKVAILVYDIQDGYSGSGGYVGGYFNGNDLYDGANSNRLDMIYVDTYPLIGTEKNLANSYSTMAHEFQHMVNLNCNKDQDGQMETWLNEALSLAAEHLYEGVQSSRISYYNNSTAIADGRSVMDWNNSDSLPNYALSYLFSQYLRTQAEAKLGDGEKTDIYKQIISDPGNANTALTNAIKANIDPTMSQEKFMTNFRVAMALKANSGVYSFGKDAALFNGITTKLSTDSSADLKGGGAIVKAISGPFQEPAEHGNDITYVGIY